MIVSRITDSVRKADYGALILEMFVLIVGILLALAADRWNQERLDALETSRVVDRLKSDSGRNLAMFEDTLPRMEEVLISVQVLFRALIKCLTQRTPMPTGCDCNPASTTQQRKSVSG